MIGCNYSIPKTVQMKVFKCEKTNKLSLTDTKEFQEFQTSSQLCLKVYGPYSFLYGSCLWLDLCGFQHESCHRHTGRIVSHTIRVRPRINALATGSSHCCFA